MDKKVLTREIDITNAQIETRAEGDNQSLILTFPFSSETPVERWFGEEILLHDNTSADFTRLNTGAALLFNHDPDKHIGVVEKAWIGSDKRGYATVRFGSNPLALEKLKDIQDGILKKVSFAYVVRDFLQERQDDKDIYKATKWEALEISFVTIPADNTVGLRYFTQETETKNNATIEVVAEKNKTMEENKMERTEEVKEILALGEKTGFQREANEFVKEDKSLDEFRGFVIEKLQAKHIDQHTVDMTKQEEREYSFLKAINAVVAGDWRGAELEKEVSEELSKKQGRTTEGFFVPLNVLFKRDINKTVSADGGYLVANQLLAGSFIDLLSDNLVSAKLGVNILGGLVSDITIPKQTAGSSYYWVAEDGAPTKSTSQFGTVSLAPKTIAGQQYITRKMLLQSSVAIENLIRQDLAKALATGIDEALINGSGASNQPTGILNTSNVNLIAIGTNGGAITYAHIVALEKAVFNSKVNAGNFAFLINPNVWASLKQTVKYTGTGTPILDGDNVDGYPYVLSTLVPSNLTKGTGTNLSAVLFGAWDNAFIGNWGSLEILPTREKDKGGLLLTAFMDVDIAVRYPEAFSVIKDAVA